MADEKLIKFVTSRQSKLENDKSNYEDRMQDVADYVAPHRDDIRGDRVKGERQGNKIFDGTAVSAAVLATDGIHGYHVSPAFDWFRYAMNRKAANKLKEVKEWLGEVEFNMYQALNRSNFYATMWSYIYDGFTIGTSSIYMEEDLVDDKLVFEAVHPGEFYIAENKHGEVDIHHRKKKMSLRKIVQMFGTEVLPPEMKTLVDTQPFSEFEVVHAVFPRDEFDDRLKDAKNKRYASVWLLTAGNHLLKESGFDAFPYHVWRYLKTGKDVYGTSPSNLAMADIKGINIMAKTLLGAAQLATDPSYNVPSYLEGKVQVKPRGMNYMKNQGDSITPINSGLNYPVGLDREEAKQRQIRERFHVDTFLLLTQLAGSGQKTATEVNELMAEKAAVLGAELGPFNVQVGSILEGVIAIETAAGRMPEMPDVLLDMAEEDDTLRFDPVYQGPLAQAQRDRFGKDPIRNFLVDIAPIIEIDEDVLDNYNWDEATRILGDLNGIPAEMENSRADVVNIRRGKALAAQQAEQEENLQQGVEGVKTLSEADKNLDGQLSQAIQGGVGGPA